MRATTRLLLFIAAIGFLELVSYTCADLEHEEEDDEDEEEADAENQCVLTCMNIIIHNKGGTVKNYGCSSSQPDIAPNSSDKSNRHQVTKRERKSKVKILAVTVTNDLLCHFVAEKKQEASLKQWRPNVHKI